MSLYCTVGNVVTFSWFEFDFYHHKWQILLKLLDFIMNADFQGRKENHAGMKKTFWIFHILVGREECT